jgi:hypothetical protein
VLGDGQHGGDLVSVRYHVLVSDDLMASKPSWPTGLRPVEQEPTDPGTHPGMHWWLFEDDDAPLELEGKNVELSFDVHGARITHRQVMA